MQQFYAYLYKDVDDTSIYVGKGMHKRAWKHFKANTHLGRLLRKRNIAGYTIEPIIYKCENEELAFFVESELIRKYGREDLNKGTLFNLTDGGEGCSGYKHSDENRLLFKQPRNVAFKSACKGCQIGKIVSVESRINMSIAHVGISNGSHTIETKNKISATLIGHSVSDTNRKKYSDRLLNLPNVMCPHCNKTGSKMIMSRWHFDKCKNRVIL